MESLNGFSVECIIQLIHYISELKAVSRIIILPKAYYVQLLLNLIISFTLQLYLK
jgi:hypothetical protein